MNKTLRLLAVAISLILIISAFATAVPAGASAAEGDSGVRYTEKIVSVVYDNSGSMRDSDYGKYTASTTTEHRSQYAEYALQMLMALLGSNDTLVITPMTENGDKVESVAQGFEVDLSAPDRDAEIKRVMATYKSLLSPYGDSTPKESIEIAVQQLVDRGMLPAGAEESVSSDKEYWLVILTDGAFTGVSMTESLLTPHINAYSSFQMIYMGMGSGAQDLSSSSLVSNPNFVAYHASLSTDYTAAMQDIANRLSGRYTLPTSALTANGNTIAVDLDYCNFPLRSVSFVAQNCGATLVSASYAGTALTPSQVSEITPEKVLGMQNGCSAVINGAPLFSEGDLVLTFSGPVSPESLSVMVEPALYVVPVMECQKDGQWAVCDSQYVSDMLNVGDVIRMSYEVYEQGTNKKIDLATIFGDVEAKVSADGKNYLVNEAIPLKEGKNEISMAVSVMDGAYTIYATLNCFIEVDHTHYRVEAALQENIGGSATRSESTFTVFVNNKKLDASGLNDYKWSVTVTDGSGSAVSVEPTVNSDGTVTVLLDTEALSYGACTVAFEVISPYNVSRKASTTVYRYPSTMVLTLEGADTLSMSQHEFKFNKEQFVFSLAGEGESLAFDNGITTYTVTFDGVDVTSYCTLDGSKLYFLPTVDNTGDFSTKTPGTAGTVKVTVVGDNKASLRAEATATLTLTPTAYAVIPIEAEDGTVDRFSLKNNEVSAYFAVTRDGINLTEEELAAALESGEFKITSGITNNFLLPAGEELTVVTVDGTPCIRCRVVSDQPGILRLFTSMLLFGGDKKITADYDNVEGVGNITVGKASFFSYLWRILLILLIIHIILIIVCTKKSPRHKKGYLVRIAMGAGARSYPSGVTIKKKNFTWKDRMVPGRILNPMAAQKPYGEGRYAKVTVNKKDGNDMITISGVRENNCLRFRERDIVQTDKYETYKRMVDAIRAGQTPRFDRTGVDITTEQFRALFPYSLQHNNANAAMNVVSPGRTERLVSRVVYAVYDDSRFHNLQAIVFFVAR